MATASLVLGILSLVCGLFGFGFRWVGIILAVIAIIFAFKNKAEDKTALAKAGKICAIIGLILCVIFLAVEIVAVGLFSAYVGTGVLDALTELLHALSVQLTS